MLCSRTVWRIRAIRARRSSGGMATAARMASATPSVSYGLTSRASRSWEGAPAHGLGLRGPSSSRRTEMNSSATTFVTSGRRHTHEHEPRAILTQPLEAPPDGEETLGDSLGVVEPLDAHAHEFGRDPELRKQLLPGGLGRIVDEGGRHADGERLDGGRV